MKEIGLIVYSIDHGYGKKRGYGCVIVKGSDAEAACYKLEQFNLT